jgi:hypothetical protein
MKIGIFEVHRLRRHPGSGRRELPWDALAQDLSPAARQVVARVARSEVKNYLAELAEKAEIPFVSAQGFVTALQGASKGVASGELTARPITCEDLGHDPRVHSPSGRAEMAREAAQ